MEEIHTDGGLMNHLELLWPHQDVTSQEVVQRSVIHELHHHGVRLAAQSIDGHKVFGFQCSHVRCLVYYSPEEKKSEKLTEKGNIFVDMTAKKILSYSDSILGNQCSYSKLKSHL